MASLPPLSSEIFAEKVLATKASAAATAARASFEKPCTVCQKTYYSENAYNNHLNSQKHKANVTRAQKAVSSTTHDDETASMLSSAFSMGEPVVESESKDVVDVDDAEAEFSQVVNDIKNTSLDEKEPVSRRPTRPHHSSAEDRPEHPLSTTTTATTTMEDDDTASTASTSKYNANPMLNCLFCNFASPTFPLNVQHMGRFHGMFVPEKDYLIDTEGLITYLWNKINDLHECLYCGKVVHTTPGIQTHMRDRGHCMIAFESEEELIEIGQFYDFTSTYSDAEEEGDDSDSFDSTTNETGGIKLGAARQATTTTISGDASAPAADDEGWETDSTLSDVPTDEITAIPLGDRSHRYALLARSRHHSHGDPRPHRSADGWHSHAHATPVAVYHDEFELHLPSGRTAGHRSLNRYYRQNLRNYPGVAERMELQQQQRRAIASGSESSLDRDAHADGDMGGRGRQLVTRGNGGLGMVGVSEAKKAEIRAVEKRERRREQRERNKYQAGNEKRGNLQKHFRVSPTPLFTSLGMIANWFNLQDPLLQ